VKRLSAQRLVELAGEFSGRDRAILETVAARLISGRQLERLFFSGGQNPVSNARLARRTFARLVERGVLGRLERRIGGVRAGAAGQVFFVTGRGQRCLAYWQGHGLIRPRSAHEPTAAFARHALAISECYVRLVEADRLGVVELLDFESEPGCWHSFTGAGGARQWVKPDALVRLAAGEFEARSWLEVDLGTEGRGALLRKARAYLACYRSGTTGEGFPKVVWLVTNARRTELLVSVCSSLPADAWKLFAVTTPERLLAVLAGGEK
jgi:protein involved in plasmid replication-relaxation